MDTNTPQIFSATPIVDLSTATIPLAEIVKLIPEEKVWLDSLKTDNTRKSYRQDVAQFIFFLGFSTSEQLYAADHRAVSYFEKYLREELELESSTICRKLSAISSLFKHLVDHGVTLLNPVREIKRPEMNSREGKTLAFSPGEARKILDAPHASTLAGLRDRAILSIGFQAGLRREEIVKLPVSAIHRNKGFDALWVRRKRKRDRTSVTINPQTANRIFDYLRKAGHGDDFEGALFRPVRNNSSSSDATRNLHPEAVDRILKKYAREVLGSSRGYSAHSMRATFATTALENDAKIEEVQRTMGHRDISTTRLYDRRGHNPEKAAAFFANY